MARKTKIVVIPGMPDGDKNRDGGKMFVITEMPSSQWHFWLYRIAQAIGRTGVDMPSNVGEMDPIFLSKIALRALGMMPYDDVRDLLGQLISCVKIARTKVPEAAQDLLGEYGDQDIEDVSTMFRLESEVVELHAGFSIAAALSESTSTPAKTSPESSTPQTSPAPTPSSSAAA